MAFEHLSNLTTSATTTTTATAKTRATGDDLPNELLLLIFPHLPLQSLIFCRGVSKRWRSLILSADLDPSRRSLLTLYLNIIQSPIFLASRPHIIPHLKSFDRTSYLSPLNNIPSHISPPKEFQLWIEEWPEKAVIGWIWPGLKDDMYEGEDKTGVRMRGVCNCLGHTPPYIKTVTYTQRISPVTRETTYHATTFLPADIQVVTSSEEMSWVNEVDEAEGAGAGGAGGAGGGGWGGGVGKVMMVNIDVTALCVYQFSNGGAVWLVLDGARGGDKMKGVVYKGGFGMRPEDIMSNSWVEFLENELTRQENIALASASPEIFKNAVVPNCGPKHLKF